MVEEVIVPSEEKHKLFPFLPTSILPVIVTTLLSLGILLFDSTGNFSTNPIVFYSIPFIYSLIFLTRDSFAVILQVVGIQWNNIREKITTLLSIPVGWMIGKFFVTSATTTGAIFKISTYPWAVTSLATAGILSTFSPSTSFILYLVVAIFEESAAIIMGKTAGNFLFKKGMRGLPASVVGYLLGRLALVVRHWFSYGGFQEPGLYVSALVFFVIFTIAGIIVALIARGAKDNELSADRVVPISLIVMVTAHLSFDFIMSQLMVIL